MGFRNHIFWICFIAGAVGALLADFVTGMVR